MIYCFDFETPANTAETAKLPTRMKMAKGVTYKVEIEFPPGPAHLLHLQIRHGAHSVWPTNPEGDFAGDDVLIAFEDEYPLITEPYELMAYTWNEDDTHNHRVIIRVGVRPLAIVESDMVQSLYQSWQVAT